MMTRGAGHAGVSKRDYIQLYEPCVVGDYRIACETDSSEPAQVDTRLTDTDQLAKLSVSAPGSDPVYNSDDYGCAHGVRRMRRWERIIK
jgi:hypothetical protein